MCCYLDADALQNQTKMCIVYTVTCTISLKIMIRDRLRFLFQFQSIEILKCAASDVVAVVLLLIFAFIALWQNIVMCTCYYGVQCACSILCERQ